MDPSAVLAFVLASVLGALLGAASGLVPGLHVNTLSLLLLSSHPLVDSLLVGLCGFAGADTGFSPLLFAALLTSAAVAGSIIDFVPSTFFGAPDDSNVLSQLPGHRLLLKGRGLEAVRCAADGSLVGIAVALLAALPIELLMRPPFSLGKGLAMAAPFLLLATMLLLVLSEKRSGAIRTWVDARRGRVEAAGTVVIAPPVPVDGTDARLSGRLEKGRWRRPVLRTGYGVWRVRVRGKVPRGQVTVSGTWRLRRLWWRNKVMAAPVMLLSGLLGLVAMNARLPFSGIFDGMGQSPLFPLLTGLFGVPTLLLSLKQRAIPAQELDPPPSACLRSSAKGALFGFLAGWMPGITSTTGTVMGTTLSRRRREDRDESAKRFIAMVSSVGSSAVVFSVLVLAIEGKGRTGAMLAAQQVLGEHSLKALSSFPSAPLALLLLSVLVSALLGHCLTVRAGRLMARRLSGLDLRALNLGLLAMIVCLVAVLNGIPGLLLLSASVLLGLVPPLLGVSRVQLTGCLLLPLVLYFFGLRDPLLALLGR